MDGKFMATGGEDGILRVWTFPDLNQVKDLEGHEKEIDDIEFSPDQTKVCVFISIWKKRVEVSIPTNISYYTNANYFTVIFMLIYLVSLNFQIISISKDRRALVWDMKKLKKHAEMGWDPPNNIKYAYKRVR